MRQGTLLILIGLIIEIVAIMLYATRNDAANVFLSVGVVFLIIGMAKNKTNQV